MNFTKVKETTSNHGRAIEAFQNKVAPRYIYLLAGVHGDEPEGVYVLHQWWSWIKEQKIDIPFIVIPCLNPDGIHHHHRWNANKVDLNRNLPTQDWTDQHKEKKYFPGESPMSEVENIFLDECLQSFSPAYIFSFHSWKRILNINGPEKKIVQLISRHNKYPVDSDIGYPTPGSFGTYGVEKYNTSVLTFELPPKENDINFEMIWNENKSALCNNDLMDLLRDRVT